MALPWPVLFLLGALVAIPWTLLAVRAPRLAAGDAAAPKPSLVAPAPPPGWEVGRPGAWGGIERFQVEIEPPEHYLAPAMCDARVPPWRFPGHARATLGELLEAAGVGEADRAALLRAAVCEPSGRACEVQPPPELVRRLPAEVRAPLYAALAKLPGNLPQARALRVRSGAIEPLLDAAGLAGAERDLVRGLFYADGADLRFADLAVACAGLSSDEQRVRLLRVLARTPTQLVRVRVREGADVEAIAAYWRWQGRARAKDIRPLLRSLARSPGGGSIDVAHLLPAFARARLFTFPDPEDPPYDCNWTAFNFFAEQPDERYRTVEGVRAALDGDYAPVPPKQAGFGDLMLFLRKDGSVAHACNHVADGVVFTKNGSSHRIPWVLMDLEQVAAMYPDATEVRVYRSKRL